jgi:hypothetical protein
MVSSTSEWGNKVKSSSMRENMLEDFTGHWCGRPQERADLFGSWSPPTYGLPLTGGDHKGAPLRVKHVSWRV